MTDATTIQIVAPRVEFTSAQYFCGRPIGTSGAVLCVDEYLKTAARLIEECGRVSHKSEGRIKKGSAEPFIKRVALIMGHESIIEHVNYTVCFVGSRSMSHQLVRHRIAAYTQESQRYCDYGGEGKDPALQVIMPPSLGAGTKLWGRAFFLEGERPIAIPPEEGPTKLEVTMPGRVYIWVRNVLECYRTYRMNRDQDVPAEDARSILPNACKTAVYTTYNLRTWRHVLKLRTEKHAQWEIRYLMYEVWKHFKQWLPWLVEDIEPHTADLKEWGLIK